MIHVEDDEFSGVDPHPGCRGYVSCFGPAVTCRNPGLQDHREKDPLDNRTVYQLQIVWIDRLGRSETRVWLSAPYECLFPWDQPRVRASTRHSQNFSKQPGVQQQRLHRDCAGSCFVELPERSPHRCHTDPALPTQTLLYGGWQRHRVLRSQRLQRRVRSQCADHETSAL